MPVSVTFRIEGMAEIERAMKELGERASNRIARSALNRVGTVVVRAAREKVPVDSGDLKRAITKRLRRHRSWSHRQILLIGVQTPTSRRAHLVEFATKTETGAIRTRPQPFLRPAMDENEGKILQVMQDAMRRGIEREAAKLKVNPRA
jgi:HK97 gp10 family phage protein